MRLGYRLRSLWLRGSGEGIQVTRDLFARCPRARGHAATASNPAGLRATGHARRVTWIPLVAALVVSVASAIPASAQIPESEYAQRRATFAERMRDGFLVLPGAPEPARDYMDF